ncbi:MAG TPA: RraA family protein [Devosia sp.]|nr:RraA family protein [Devosia sp.]
MTSGYDLRPMPESGDAAMLARLAAVATSTLGHFRLWGLCDPAIAPVVPCGRVAGVAVTLALPGADGALLHHALGQLRAGDILAIDRLGDDRHACVGGVVARAAKARGITAIVVDGPVTDTDELAAIDLPIWARGKSALTTRRLGLGGRFNAPVSVGGAVIQPGDMLLCDGDGVVCLNADECAPALRRAAELADQESGILSGLSRGATLESLLPSAPIEPVLGVQS